MLGFATAKHSSLLSALTTNARQDGVLRSRSFPKTNLFVLNRSHADSHQERCIFVALKYKNCLVVCLILIISQHFLRPCTKLKSNNTKLYFGNITIWHITMCKKLFSQKSLHPKLPVVFSVRTRSHPWCCQYQMDRTRGVFSNKRTVPVVFSVPKGPYMWCFQYKKDRTCGVFSFKRTEPVVFSIPNGPYPWCFQ